MSKNKHTVSWKTTDNRFVAFFDILGFRDLVMRENHKDIYNKLSKLSDTTELLRRAPSIPSITKEYGESDIYTVSFSDSIIFFSKNGDISNFRFFLFAIRLFFADAIKQKIPIKGGLAYGQISINKSKQIYFGQPIIDSYLIEEDVNYFGIVAHNSIDKYINSIEDDSVLENINKMFIELKTPLKCGEITHNNINWFSYSGFDTKQKLIELLNSFKQTVSGSPRRYLDNTLKVIDVINS